MSLFSLDVRCQVHELHLTLFYVLQKVPNSDTNFCKPLVAINV